MNAFELTKLIASLLQQTTSLVVVRDFLKSRDLKHSAASWDDLINKRLIPAVEANLLSTDELIKLLRSVEECGRQHIFLYKCDKDKIVELLDRTNIEGRLSTAGLLELLDKPKILSQPEQPEIVDVRIEGEEAPLSLTVKQIELREYQKHIKDELHGGYFHKIFETVKERCVNIAKLHRDGLLEIRIGSLSTTTKYSHELRKFIKTIDFLIPGLQLTELSISTAKDRLWSERSTLSSIIRYSDSTIRDEAGNILKAATGSDAADLNASIAVGKSLDLLLKEDGGSYCSSTNLWFKENVQLTVNTHVLLSGEINEFAIPAHCKEGDYEYVLKQIRFFNKPVP